jgi:hypothetical protein
MVPVQDVGQHPAAFTGQPVLKQRPGPVEDRRCVGRVDRPVAASRSGLRRPLTLGGTAIDGIHRGMGTHYRRRVIMNNCAARLDPDGFDGSNLEQRLRAKK